MGFLIMVFVGVLAGYTANLAMGTKNQIYITANIINGVLGSIFGGVLYTFLYNNEGVFSPFFKFDPRSIATCVLGAIVMISILKFVRKEDLFN